MIGVVGDRPELFELDPTAEGAWVLRDLAAWYAGGGWGTTKALDAWGTNHGTLTNMAIPASATSGWTRDDYLRRSALRLDGSNDYVEQLAAAVVAYPFTISAWFYPATANTIYTIASVGDASHAYGAGLEVSRGTTGRVSATPYGAATHPAVSSTAYAANTWQHGCAVFTSATLRTAYLNGGGAGTDANSGNLSTPTNTEIGCNYAAGRGRYFSGAVADVLFHSRALSAVEIAQLADPAWSVLMGGLIVPAGNRYVRGWKAGGVTVSTIQLPTLQIAI